MILVLNPLQQLNGNKFLLLIPILFFVFTCKVPGGDTQKTPGAKKDTLPPKDTVAIEKPEDSLPDLKLKERYHIGILLPFYLDSTDLNEYETIEVEKTIYHKSVMAVEYYEGLLIALDSLKKSGFNAVIHVFDTRKSPSEVMEIFKKPVMDSIDLIIGPVFNSNIKLAAKKAREREIPIISPLSPYHQKKMDNPYYLLPNATLSSHLKGMTDFIINKFNKQSSNIVILRDHSDHGKKTSSEITGLLKSEIYKNDTLKEIILTSVNDSISVAEKLSLTDKNIVIIPSFDPAFVSTALLQLNKMEADFPIVVFGMPTWDKYPALRIDYLQILNTHISSSFFINNNSQRVLNFKKSYYDQYHTLPSDNTYQAFDLMLFFGNMLQTYGNSFIEYLPVTQDRGLHQQFSFKPVVTANDTQYYENKYVHILKFEDYSLKKVND